MGPPVHGPEEEPLPVYEFLCADCQKTFEVARPVSQSASEVTCPSCGSHKVERRWTSVFAVTSKKS